MQQGWFISDKSLLVARLINVSIMIIKWIAKLNGQFLVRSAQLIYFYTINDHFHVFDWWAIVRDQRAACQCYSTCKKKHVNHNITPCWYCVYKSVIPPSLWCLIIYKHMHETVQVSPWLLVLMYDGKCMWIEIHTYIYSKHKNIKLLFFLSSGVSWSTEQIQMNDCAW